MTTGPWVCRVNAARGAGWGMEPAGCGAHELLQPSGGGGDSSRVTVAIVILQQQLFVEADLLQLLAQSVQLTAQLLALQLLLHQVLWGQ